MSQEMSAEQRQHVVANLSAIHRTLDVLIAVGDLESAGNIAATLGLIWFRHRYFDEGIHYLSSILNTSIPDELSDRLFVTLHDIYGELVQGQGHFEQAEAHYKTALARRIDDPRTILQLLRKIAMTADQRGLFEVAHEYCDRSVVLARQLGVADGMVNVKEAPGELVSERGSLAECVEMWARAQALSEEQGYRHALAQSLNMRGELERVQHNYRTAIDYYQASAALFKAEDPAALTVVQGNLAFALLAVGDATKAEALFAQGHRYWEAGHAPYKSALCLTGLAGIQVSMHAYRQAAHLLTLADRRFALSDGILELADRSEYERIEATIQAHLSEDELRGIQERVMREESNAPAGDPAQLDETTDLFGEGSAVSSRELEMLRLVAEGLTDKQIAVHCCISPHTVNSHMRAVYRKLQVNNRSAALHVAHRQGLL
jgi:DNA-binding CsgD family transcriptional regulator/tetratricopeptide (TPR) repeat protein